MDISDKQAKGIALYCGGTYTFSVIGTQKYDKIRLFDYLGVAANVKGEHLYVCEKKEVKVQFMDTPDWTFGSNEDISKSILAAIAKQKPNSLIVCGEIVDDYHFVKTIVKSIVEEHRCDLLFVHTVDDFLSLPKCAATRDWFTKWKNYSKKQLAKILEGKYFRSCYIGVYHENSLPDGTDPVALFQGTIRSMLPVWDGLSTAVATSVLFVAPILVLSILAPPLLVVSLATRAPRKETHDDIEYVPRPTPFPRRSNSCTFAPAPASKERRNDYSTLSASVEHVPLPTPYYHSNSYTFAPAPAPTPADPICPLSPGKYLMLSYNWGSQEMVVKVKNALSKNGYQVWIDTERMEGSTLETMGLAVENAAVILVCFSKKYKESQACKTEAEYAFTLNKPIIPLKMEKDYRADGWLGALLGSKLYYEFYDDSKFNESIANLIRALGNRGK